MYAGVKVQLSGKALKRIYGQGNRIPARPSFQLE